MVCSGEGFWVVGGTPAEQLSKWQCQAQHGIGAACISACKYSLLVDNVCNESVNLGIYRT